MHTKQRSLKVFLSYASQAELAARELYEALKLHRWIDPWLDKAKILPGQDWRQAIEMAVDEADVVIVLLSCQSVTKEGFVQREIKYACEIALEKPEGSIFLIPLRLDECTVPRSLRSLQWVDYFGAAKTEAYSNLLEALKLCYEKLEQGQSQVNVSSTGPRVPVSTEPLPPQRPATKRGLKPEYMIAMIGAIATLVAGILGSPLIEKMFLQAPEPTPTVAVSNTQPGGPISMTLVPATPVILPTFTLTPTSTLIPTVETPVTASPTAEPEIETMMADLSATQSEGKAPVKVNFDARGSHVEFMNGQVVSCGRTRFCSYTFTVYSSGKQLSHANNQDGLFSYTFSKKGEYSVSVIVCRGSVCATSARIIKVR